MSEEQTLPPLRPGFAFHFADRPDDDHLWLIASSTKEPDVVILNMTTVRRFSDTSCLIEAGEHEFVKHQTCIAYDRAEVVSMNSIEARLLDGNIEPRAPLSKELMLRIWEGAARTQNLSLICTEILKNQDLIF